MLQATGTAAGQAQVPTDRNATSDDADDCRPGAPVDRRSASPPAVPAKAVRRAPAPVG